jgi:hypothetical protein
VQATGRGRCTETLREGTWASQISGRLTERRGHDCDLDRSLTARIQAREVLQDESNVQPVVSKAGMRRWPSKADPHERNALLLYAEIFTVNSMT